MVDTQLIAHDKEVYDIAWGGVGVFASVSADGSVRVFDLRLATSCVGWSHISSKFSAGVPLDEKACLTRYARHVSGAVTCMQVMLSCFRCYLQPLPHRAMCYKAA